MSSAPAQEDTRAVLVVDLRSQVPEGLFAGGEPLRLTWRIRSTRSGLTQVGYQIQAASDAEFATNVADSGTVDGADQLGVRAPGTPLTSREVRHLRVRVRTQDGWTDWGPSLRVEAGLLEASDWVARAITLPDDPGATRQSPAPVLRTEFALAAPVRSARLYATSLGVHELAINGIPVSDALLSPGWTAYRHRLLAETHDVTRALRQGRNVIRGVLGDGWYRGRLGWDPAHARCRYGSQLGLVAQLEVDLADGTRRVIVTDETWLATTAEIRSADLYDGAVIDLRARRTGIDLPGHDTRGWRRAVTVPFDPAIIEPRMAQPVRVVAEWPVDVVRRPDGGITLDGGQNISGWVRLRVRGRAGAQVTIRHAEVLEGDGSLHTRALRSAKATDTYFLADDTETVLSPAFTFHGFRYAEVTTDAEVLAASFVAISSDLPPRGEFASSEPALDRLYMNTRWSQRDNFVSVPTDCPQRDERLGWTGDAQAFAPTACTLFDGQAFWASWLRDLALDQDDRLGVPSVVPDVVLAGEARFGRAGWADAATIVPWATYESYGDPAILRATLGSMHRWIDTLRRRQGPDGLLDVGWQFGDWLDPDAPAGRPWEAKADPGYLANAYCSWSARLAGDAAVLAGEMALGAEWHALADRVAAVTWDRWASHALTSQTGCAVALQLRIAPADRRAAVGEALACLVRDANGRVSTGFLGTPLVLPALAATDHFEEAFLMLLRREMPSWLYQVAQGATTIWERWDAIRPDGSIHPGTMTTPPDMPRREGEDPHMLSFNHYAYGAVIDWVVRHVAGLAPDPAAPGYRHVVLAPRPAIGVDRAEASIDSAYGTVAIGWRIEGGEFHAQVQLPFGTRGTLRVPASLGAPISVNGSPARASAGFVGLGPGRHEVRAAEAVVVDPAVTSVSREPGRR